MIVSNISSRILININFLQFVYLSLRHWKIAQHQQKNIKISNESRFVWNKMRNSAANNILNKNTSRYFERLSKFNGFNRLIQRLDSNT